MAPLGNTALALAITNNVNNLNLNLNPPPALGLPPAFSSITPRDDYDDVIARRKRKERIRNALIISLNPVTLIIFIMLVWYTYRCLRNCYRNHEVDKRLQAANAYREQEMERQWQANFGPQSNNYRPPPEPTTGNEGQLQMPAPATINTPRKGFMSRIWRRKTAADNSTTDATMLRDLRPEATTADPTKTLETTDAGRRPSNDSQRTTVGIETVPAPTVDDTTDEKKDIKS